jgi:hypothetical protein
MNRHEATRRVLRRLGSPDSKITLSVKAEDGSFPIVVCTPGEYLSEVLERVNLVGGSANVVLAEVKSFQVFSLHKGQGDHPSGKATGLNADLSMGMFLIKHRGKGKAYFRVTSGEEVSVSKSYADLAYA